MLDSIYQMTPKIMQDTLFQEYIRQKCHLSYLSKVYEKQYYILYEELSKFRVMPALQPRN